MSVQALRKTNLKRGLYEDSEGNQQQRYVIETKADLDAFFRAFAEVFRFKILKDSFISSFDCGQTIIATDPHPMSGFNTYCFESKRTDPNPHPGNLYLVEMLS